MKDSSHILDASQGGGARTLFQHQHSLFVLFHTHSVGFHILKIQHDACTKMSDIAACQMQKCDFLNVIQWLCQRRETNIIVRQHHCGHSAARCFRQQFSVL